jgi:glucosyl-dolichyl phosphate glucuronosyltransferase
MLRRCRTGADSGLTRLVAQVFSCIALNEIRSAPGGVDISIVVCTWNNCQRLALTLEAIGQCRIPPSVSWQIVLVNNNCSDETPSVAKRFRDQLPLLCVDEPRQGLSHARNAGLRAASGELIVFADDDITPCREWIAIYWSAYQERPRGFYFGGRLIPEYEAGPPESALLPLAGLPVAGLDWGRQPKILDSHERFLGANWACPAEALRRAGQFDVRLGLDASLGRRRVGEEWELMERLRRHEVLPWYLPDAVVAHFVPAHKCRLGYLAENWEAHGHRVGFDSVTDTPLLRRWPQLRAGCRDGGIRIAGAPWWTYYEEARWGVRYLISRARGDKAYTAYAAWRFYRGVTRGQRERGREERNAG